MDPKAPPPEGWHPVPHTHLRPDGTPMEVGDYPAGPWQGTPAEPVAVDTPGSQPAGVDEQGNLFDPDAFEPGTQEEEEAKLLRSHPSTEEDTMTETEKGKPEDTPEKARPRVPGNPRPRRTAASPRAPPGRDHPRRRRPPRPPRPPARRSPKPRRPSRRAMRTHRAGMGAGVAASDPARWGVARG